MFVQTEVTPNPNSLKFLPGKKVSNNGPYEITKKEAKIIAREVRRRLSTRNKYCLITQNELLSIFLDLKDKL